MEFLPNGERIPNVRVERLLASGVCCWSRLLVEVEDDLESRYLAAQRSKLEFALTVPNHGALFVAPTAINCFCWGLSATRRLHVSLMSGC